MVEIPDKLDKQFLSDLARLEQLMTDRTNVISDIARVSSENMLSLGRLETKVAMVSTMIESGMSKTMEAIQEKFTLHEHREEITRTRLLSIFLVLIAAVLGLIGYLFSLHFGPFMG